MKRIQFNAGYDASVWLAAALILTGCTTGLPNKETKKIDSQRLEYTVQGINTPCVVFESGMGLDMDSWIKVFPDVAKFSTAFAYNRPTYGRSKPRMGANTGTRIVTELHQLLRETGCHPPYVLVGHSFGGLFINLFARTYPSEVAGVVFVDSGHPDQGKWSKENNTIQTAVIAMVIGYLQRHSSLPPSLYEYYDVDRVSEDVNNAGPFPNVPVRVITSGKPGPLVSESWQEQWSKYQKDLASLSPQSKHILAEGSGHFIQDEMPQLVIDAIREVVELTPKKPK